MPALVTPPVAYGWCIHIDRCAFFEDPALAQRVFSLTLVQPCYTIDDGAGHQMLSDPSVAGPQAADLPAGLLAGTLFRPWRWNAVRWVVYGWAAGLAPQALATVDWDPGDPTAVDNPDRILGLVEADLAARTAHCEHPFSQLAEHLAGGPDVPGMTSLPHALAPMTHWPALISAGVLKRTGYVQISEAAFTTAAGVALTDIACFPEFKPAPGQPAISPQIPVLLPQRDKRPALALAPYSDAHVAMVSNTAGAAEPQPAGGTLTIDQGQISRAGRRALASAMLSPPALLASWMATMQTSTDPADPGPALLKQWMADGNSRIPLMTWLLRGLGRGFERGTDQFHPHLSEWFSDDAVAAGTLARFALSLWSRPLDPIASLPGKATAALDMLANRKATAGAAPPSWSVAQMAVWARARKTWSDFVRGQPVPLDDWSFVVRCFVDPSTSRDVLGPWLAMLLEDAVSTNGQPDPDWNRIVAGFAADGAIDATLLSRAMDGTLLPGQWTAIDQLPAAAAVAALSEATKDALADCLGQQVPPAVARYVEDRVQALAGAIQAVGQPARPRPRDGGLTLRFESLDPAALTFDDQARRGYAIGLWAGTSDGSSPWPTLPDQAQWITDTEAFAVAPGSAPASADWVTLAGGGPVAKMHEAIGSTFQDGQRSVDLEYAGRPAAVPFAPSTTDPGLGGGTLDDGAVHYRWLNGPDSPLPSLGYGLYYAGVACEVDNAGGVQAPAAWRTSFARLRPLHELPAPAQAGMPYLSAETPSAPDPLQPVPNEAYAFSDATRASAWRAQTSKAPQHGAVALLLHDQMVGNMRLFKAAAAPLLLDVRLPGTHADFCRRWFETDWLCLRQQRNAQLSMASLQAGTPAALRSFIDALGVDDGKPDFLQAGFHPGVRAVGVALWVDDAPPDTPTKTWTSAPTDPILWDAQAQAFRIVDAATRSVALRVNAGATDDPVPHFAADPSAPAGRSFVITLGQGHFARIRIYSLVPESFFSAAGSASRYQPGLDAPADDWRADAAGARLFPGWRAFGYREHWVEVAPPWKAATGTDATVTIALQPPATPDQTVLESRINFSGDVAAVSGLASWVGAMNVQRHEWHWTGLPVDLSSQDDLQSWLASFSASGSSREVIDKPLARHFESPPIGNAAGPLQWMPGADATRSDLVQRLALRGGFRPSRYAAYVARLVLPLRSLLNPALAPNNGPFALERLIIAKGCIVPGVTPADLRVPALPLRWAIPLTASYAAGVAGDSPTRAPNGALLVIDDALRRTDDLAHMGGLGDTLDIDVLETRDPTLQQIGLNPLFYPQTAVAHAPDPSTATVPVPFDTSMLSLQASPLFALTHDIGANPRAAQTATVLTPVNAGGRWLMAQVRARRYLLPEKLLGNEAPTAQPPHGPATAALPPNWSSYAIDLRRDGEDRVPADHAVDFNGSRPASLHFIVSVLQASDGQPAQRDLSVDLADLPSDPDPTHRHRLLVSWHKGRWAGGQVSWRCQVLLQDGATNQLSWITVARLGCPRTPASDLPGSLAETGSPSSAWLAVAPQSAVVNGLGVFRVQMSDYTEPLWLSFIGSFGTSSMGNADQYVLTHDAATEEIALSAIGGAALPQLQARGAHTSTFHLLVVLAPLSDLTRGDPTPDSGMPVATFEVSDPGNPAMGIGPRFKRLAMQAGVDRPLAGLNAQILTLQRTSAASIEERAAVDAATSFEVLVGLAFPSQGADDHAVESTLRFVPEVFGPIAVTNLATN
jgi:hypothetical protein